MANPAEAPLDDGHAVEHRAQASIGGAFVHEVIPILVQIYNYKEQTPLHALV